MRAMHMRKPLSGVPVFHREEVVGSSAKRMGRPVERVRKEEGSGDVPGRPHSCNKSCGSIWPKNFEHNCSLSISL
jgi:hypothetical protein